MTKTWANLSQREREAVEERFTVAEACAPLSRYFTERDDPGERILVQDLANYLSGHGRLTGQKVSQSLAKDRRLRRKFDKLLAAMALDVIPSAAAASSGDVAERRIGDLVLRVVESRANSDQVYVILAYPTVPARTPGKLVARREADIAVIDLPEMIDGQTQVLLSTSDPVVGLLRDSQTTVSLI